MVDFSCRIENATLIIINEHKIRKSRMHLIEFIELTNAKDDERISADENWTCFYHDYPRQLLPYKVIFQGKSKKTCIKNGSSNNLKLNLNLVLRRNGEATMERKAQKKWGTKEWGKRDVKILLRSCKSVNNISNPVASIKSGPVKLNQW